MCNFFFPNWSPSVYVGVPTIVIAWLITIYITGGCLHPRQKVIEIFLMSVVYIKNLSIFIFVCLYIYFILNILLICIFNLLIFYLIFNIIKYLIEIPVFYQRL